MKMRDQPSAHANMSPQPGEGGETNKNYSKNASETREKAARAPRVHEQFAAAEKKSFAKLVPSKFGRRNDAPAIARRTEAYEAELQHAVSAVEDFGLC